jgi:hypothetical protein
MNPTFNRRGNLLITVMIFTAVIAIGLTNYVRLATNNYQLAQRAFVENAALALAESGLDRGVATLNKIPALGLLNAFSGWTTNLDGNATVTLDTFDLGGGTTGVVKVCVTGWNLSTISPSVVSKATVTQANGIGVTRYFQTQLTQLTPFVGLLSTGNISFGLPSISFSTWNSCPNGLSGAKVAFSTAYTTANTCFVGTVGGGTVSYGNYWLGGSMWSRFRRHVGVSSGGFTLFSSAGGNFGANRCVTQPAVISVPAVPTTFMSIGTAITSSTTFPRAGDVAAADGAYYYVFARAAVISLPYDGQFKIAANTKCVFYMTAHVAVRAIDVNGFGSLLIDTGASLTVYTNGHLRCLGWWGLINRNNHAPSFTVYGVHPTVGAQTFEWFGWGNFVGAVHAPNANVSWNGAGRWTGALVGHNISFPISAGFAYDSGMLQILSVPGIDTLWGAGNWQEYTTQTDRVSVAGLLNL